MSEDPTGDGDDSPDRADGGRPDGGARGERLDPPRGDRGKWEVTDSGAMITTGDTTVIARTSVRIVVPIIVLTSISLLFQGHNLPGGGFIGGVLTAIAFALVYVVYGLDYVQETVYGVRVEREGEDDRHRGGTRGYEALFSVGLALAAGSGLVPILLGLAPGYESYPFLTQAVFFFEDLPLYGTFEVASAFAFDLGVYLVVVGGLLTIVREVGEE